MIILVSGAHGSGKSELCRKFVQRRKDEWVHRSASSLIKKQLNERRWNNSKKTKEIEDNQRLLAMAIEHEKSCLKNIVLDGHFVLRNSNGSIIPVPIHIVQAIGPCGVVLVEAPSSIILARLRIRDTSKITEEEVVVLTLQERLRALEVCRLLNLPLKIVTLPKIEQFAAAVDEVSCER